eukprot:CAMPEP_0206446248 /NCGR_PEP_ID=MMETSP0324_2-20121206/16021_1 /ASSEMBLY_ACC=CAM_ASM_000836 /TAXON_ID=2866 /ORGANISM="Crypthecodinium cohnii, Strain Seligo" /LENGTH=70 /DNA_ID=CAMNT_0053914679 /DNA_START=18 /DNA_END=230 /DNA_ORIENTATION=-
MGNGQGLSSGLHGLCHGGHGQVPRTKTERACETCQKFAIASSMSMSMSMMLAVKNSKGAAPRLYNGRSAN